MPMQSVEYLEEALALYKADVLDDALDLVRRALGTYPDDGRLWELSGLIHRAQSDCPSCLNALETAMTLIPLSAAGQSALADCYLHAGRFDLAKNICLHLHVWRNDIPIALLRNLVGQLEQLGELELAVQVCLTATSRDPESAEHWYSAAYYMGQLDYSPGEVEEMAGTAVSLAPQRSQYRIGLAGFMQQQGKIDDAYELVRDLTETELCVIPCQRCLQRLLSIYVAADEEYRAHVCREQLEISSGRRPDGGWCDC